MLTRQQILHGIDLAFKYMGYIYFLHELAEWLTL